MSARLVCRATAVPLGLCVALSAADAWGSSESTRLEAELRSCRAIVDSISRVACYDGIALPAAATPVAAASAAAPPPASRVASTPGGLSGPTGSREAELVRDFGLPERPATRGPQAVESAISGDFDGWTPGAKLRLANGQVWEVIDGSTAAYEIMRNPKARVSRGMLGSFFLQIDGVSQSPRVRRVQ